MDSETVSFFGSLGLTEYESKAVLALIHKSSLEAPEISRNGEIPKTRVYDILEKLEGKGLVIALEGRPKKYQAIETEKIIEKLMESKKKEFTETQKNAEKLREKLNFKGKNVAKESILRVKHLSDFDRILGQEILKAKKTVIGFTEIKEKRHYLDEALGKAMEKKVQVQLISSDREAEKFFSNTKLLTKNSSHSLNAFVIDGKKIVLGLDSFKEEKPHYHLAILQNKSLAEAITGHFKSKWKD
ncbi:hypothetical protein KKB11_02705 [Candidatus Micrarchaeota archaeon]|nr:hypothetical protein [Candidatus Micrarchaeota archaeon]